MNEAGKVTEMIFADVIGATPSICADERIYFGAHPNVIVIDEVIKVMEMYLLPVFAYFPHYCRFILPTFDVVVALSWLERPDKTMHIKAVLRQ